MALIPFDLSPVIRIHPTKINKIKNKANFNLRFCL